MTEHEPIKLDPRQKAERFIELQKKYTVLPLDDVNLPEDLYRQRMLRMMDKNLWGNESLSELSSLFEGTHISDFFKQQLVYEFAWEQVMGWTGWDESQDAFLSNYLGISLDENKYGIFDPDPVAALKAEANYYYNILPLLEFREETGILNPVSLSEWGKDLFKRVHENMI